MYGRVGNKVYCLRIIQVYKLHINLRKFIDLSQKEKKFNKVTKATYFRRVA